MIRPWPIASRSNQTCRPLALDVEADLNKAVIDLAESNSPWTIFLETVEPDSGATALPEFDKESDVLLFFKLYNPKEKKIAYVGHSYMPITSKASTYAWFLLFS